MSFSHRFGPFILYCIFFLTITQISCTPGLSDQSLLLAEISVGEASRDIQEKIHAHQRKVRQNPLDPKSVGELGIVYELHGFPNQAIQAYQLASQLDPRESRWPYYQAILLAARFDIEDALRQIELAIQVNPSYTPMWINQGRMLLNIGDHEAALESFARAEEIGSDPYIFFGQAKTFLALGEYDKALATVRRAGELVSHPNITRLEATIHIRRGEVSRSEKLLGTLPDDSPDLLWSDPIAEYKSRFAVKNLSHHLADATALIRELEIESAFELLKQLKDEYPTNKHVLQMLSDVYEIQNRPSLALSELNLAIVHHPEYYPHRTAAARILRAQGKLEEALSHLDEAIEFEPHLVWAYTHKAQILMSQKKWLEASVVLESAIEVSPEDPDLYTHLGICLGFLNRWPESQHLFNIALTIDDSHIPTLINLARAQAILGDIDAASKTVEVARVNGASSEQITAIGTQISQIREMPISIEKR